MSIRHHLLAVLSLLFSLSLTLTNAHHYIITFTSYQPQSHHEAVVRTALSLTPPTSYVILTRHNTASTLPTDFVVLSTSHPSILPPLRNHPSIRHIASQTGHLRAPRAILPLPSHASPRVHAFNAGALWRRGHTGAGIHVAVFDTGLISNTLHFPNLALQTDWTGENTTIDNVGHGTFVAGLIAGHHPGCPGIAPDVTLHIFRVFTGAQMSYTSWFLDAFNYALHIGIDVLNLSIGGPDFADRPFVDKVNELTASGIIVTSAIGNDGPLWGTLNNPADMMDVVGVGGVEPDATIARFSSRGMTTHELDASTQTYGRVKPDLMAYARSLVGPCHQSVSQCKRLSGTSVASPIVAGAIALLASTIPKGRRHRVITPAGIKRVLIRSARLLSQASVYEQGAGLLDMDAAYQQLQILDSEFINLSPTTNKTTTNLNFASRFLNQLSSSPPPPAPPPPPPRISRKEDTRPGPKATFFPPFYDFRATGCPHMWPHCAQGLYLGALPVTINVTILNPGGVQGLVQSVEWIGGTNANLIRVEITLPLRFWPWAAGMGVHISVISEPQQVVEAMGILQVRVVSVLEMTHSDIQLPIKLSVIPRPPREKRLLWDMYHSIRYPPGYVPRDSLEETKDMLDWLGDHPHTNFHTLFRHFIQRGFHIDILDQSLACLGTQAASEYGGILFLDSEDLFTSAEIDLTRRLVFDHGVSLIIAADWYDVSAMRDIRFEDDNTRSWWSPIIAGANIPAINTLLSPFHISFSTRTILRGDIHTGSLSFRFESGTPITSFPAHGELLFSRNMQRYKGLKRSTNAQTPGAMFVTSPHSQPVLGRTRAGKGAVLVYGDTNCIDTAYSGSRCYDFFVHAVAETVSNCAQKRSCPKMLIHSTILSHALSDADETRTGFISQELLDVFKPHSRVLQDGWSVFEAYKNSTIDDAQAHAACARWNVGRERARMTTAPEGMSSVQLPARARAEAVGSERNYYHDYNVRTLYTNRIWGSGRALSALCAGAFLIVASMWLRVRKRRGVMSWRRSGRLRSLRMRRSGSEGCCSVRE